MNTTSMNESIDERKQENCTELTYTQGKRTDPENIMKKCSESTSESSIPRLAYIRLNMNTASEQIYGNENGNKQDKHGAKIHRKQISDIVSPKSTRVITTMNTNMTKPITIEPKQFLNRNQGTQIEERQYRDKMYQARLESQRMTTEHLIMEANKIRADDKFLTRKDNNLLLSKNKILARKEYQSRTKRNRFEHGPRGEKWTGNFNTRILAHHKHHYCRCALKHNRVRTDNQDITFECDHEKSISHGTHTDKCYRCGYSQSTRYTSECDCDYSVCKRCKVSTYCYAGNIQFYDKHVSPVGDIIYTRYGQDENDMDMDIALQTITKKWIPNQSRKDFLRELSGKAPLTFAQKLKSKKENQDSYIDLCKTEAWIPLGKPDSIQKRDPKPLIRYEEKAIVETVPEGGMVSTIVEPIKSTSEQVSKKVREIWISIKKALKDLIDKMTISMVNSAITTMLKTILEAARKVFKIFFSYLSVISPISIASLLVAFKNDYQKTAILLAATNILRDILNAEKLDIAQLPYLILSLGKFSTLEQVSQKLDKLSVMKPAVMAAIKEAMNNGTNMDIFYTELAAHPECLTLTMATDYVRENLFHKPAQRAKDKVTAFGRFVKTVMTVAQSGFGDFCDCLFSVGNIIPAKFSEGIKMLSQLLQQLRPTLLGFIALNQTLS